MFGERAYSTQTARLLGNYPSNHIVSQAARVPHPQPNSFSINHSSPSFSGFDSSGLGHKPKFVLEPASARMPLPKLLPKPSEDGAPPEPQQAVKRKRGSHHTACNHCRAKREKCSGTRPICSTCERLSIQCVYEAPLGVTRQQAYKQRMANMERSSTSLREIVELLRQGSEADAAVALGKIRQAGDVDEAIGVLALAQALVTPTTSNSRTSPGSFPRFDENTSTGFVRSSSQRSFGSSTGPEYLLGREPFQTRDQYNEDAPIDLPVLSLPISRWTSVCKDNRFLNHLLTLFWTWDNTVEPSLYRPLFEEDLANYDSQTSSSSTMTFCTPFLVNALLALSCLIVPEHSYTYFDDRSTRSRQFAKEAERHLEREKEAPSITLLQGQFAMFAWEGNVGAGTKAIDYFLDATRTYDALNDSLDLGRFSGGKDEARLVREKEGVSWIMWGLYCAEWRVSQTFGFQKPTGKPLIPKLWRDSTFALSQPDNPSYWWQPYPASLRTQRSLKVEIRDVDSHLSEIAEDDLDYLYPSPDGSLESPMTNVGRAIEVYNALVQWKFSLPARLRLEDAVLPSAILLHSYVEMLLVAILRPFGHLTETQFGPFKPKDRCYSHCTSLMDTIWTFRAFTSLHGEYWYIPMLATVAFMTFREHAHSPVLTETLIKACKCLDEMTSMYPLASDALNAVRGAFRRTNMPVPTYLQAFLVTGAQHREDGLLHHAVAKLMPEEDWSSESREELRYQELLDGLKDVEMDGVEKQGDLSTPSP